MKKEIIATIWLMIASIYLGGVITQAIVCDNLIEQKCDSEYLDLLEFAYEHDYNCTIKEADYHYLKDKKLTWLCVSNKNENNTWIVNLELKHLGICKYEWVSYEE